MGAGLDRSRPTISDASHKAKISKHNPSMTRCYTKLRRVWGRISNGEIRKAFVHPWADSSVSGLLSTVLDQKFAPLPSPVIPEREPCDPASMHEPPRWSKHGSRLLGLGREAHMGPRAGRDDSNGSNFGFESLEYRPLRPSRVTTENTENTENTEVHREECLLEGKIGIRVAPICTNRNKEELLLCEPLCSLCSLWFNLLDLRPDV